MIFSLLKSSSFRRLTHRQRKKSTGRRRLNRRLNRRRSMRYASFKATDDTQIKGEECCVLFERVNSHHFFLTQIITLILSLPGTRPFKNIILLSL